MCFPIDLLLEKFIVFFVTFIVYHDRNMKLLIHALICRLNKKNVLCLFAGLENPRIKDFILTNILFLKNLHFILRNGSSKETLLDILTMSEGRKNAVNQNQWCDSTLFI